jgi:F-type H+-transporting ATPase subunit epsilon
MTEGKLEVVIVTPAGQKLSTQADEVVAPGHKGQFGVLPGHIEVLTHNPPGLFVVVEGGRRETWAVGAGFIEVGPNRVQLLVQSAERAAEIDVQRAEDARKRAETRIATLDFNQTAPEFEHAELRLKRAETRLEAAKLN